MFAVSNWVGPLALKICNAVAGRIHDYANYIQANNAAKCRQQRVLNDF